MNQEDNKLKARSVDSLLNFETVKYYGAEKYEVDQYSNVMVKYQVINYNFNMIQNISKWTIVFQIEEWKSTASLNLLNTVQNFIMTTGLLAGSMLSVYYVSDVSGGQMTIGDFVLFGIYFVI